MTSRAVGVVLAGGTGSRLLPLTRAVNKHLLPVLGRPMLHWPLRALAELGLSRVVVVLGGRSCGAVVETLGTRYETGTGDLDLAYVYQDGAGGIPSALLCARTLLADLCARRVVVVLGDNAFPDGLDCRYDSLLAPGAGVAAVLATRDVRDVSSYGCVAGAPDGSSFVYGAIAEKPTHAPPEGLAWHALPGVYSLPVTEALAVAAALRPSPRGETEVADLLLEFAAVGCLTVTPLRSRWVDAGEGLETYRGIR